ncbi:Phospholipid-transporting ATPase 1 [Hordeum vulgare]|nr:Phospholipid-transporting ATPase 1 [Hordeum vulgare]
MSSAGYNEDQAAFMRDQVGLDLDDFPLDHEFPEDYGLEEEDECDIETEPLFEDELANQADGTKPKRKSKRTKAYAVAEDKLLCECSRDIGQDPKTGAEQKHSTFWIRVHPLDAFKVQHNGKFFNLFHCFRVIKDEEKFKAQYAALKSRGGKQAVEEVGDDEKARPRGKTNSKKVDKWDAASIALIATVEGMITKKDSREEKSRQGREEEMNAFLKIQRRKLEMEAEKQAQMLEMEAEKQAKMLEIEAANAKTKAKEAALASMMTTVEIMKVDLNTVSSRKRPWFEKMQADMFKFDEE